ncbi:MAG: efflux RND transporter periplasmic adaptor subunit [Nitrospinae bacterium]|nr:efflux RND transporter periplasmic adaptor subunit [Nitrospinota bacterium]
MSDRSQTRELFKFSGFIILAIVLGVGFFYREDIIPYVKDIVLGKPAPAHKEITAQDTSKQAERKKERKILYWTDPMIPSFKSDKPGKSPMNMDMVPVYADEEEVAAGIVKIDPATVKSINVRTEKVIKKPLRRSIRTTGRIDYDERKVTHIHTKIQGWVEKLYVDFTGKEVNEGDMLLEVYSPELVSAQQEYLLALEYAKSLKDSKVEGVTSGAESLLESARKRLQLFDVAEHQIKELEETKKPKKTLHIHSPVHGIVVQKNLLKGMFVTPETHLYVITDISKIWVYADIYEYEVPWVKVGQTAEMTLSYFSGKVFKGVVTYIYPYLQAETRTVKVRMEFDNPDWELKPDMYANVKLESKMAESAILVPSEAVIRSGVRDIIIVSKGEGVFEPRDVLVGVDTGDGYLQILEGVKAGEDVVTSAQFLIDSESKLKEAVDKMRQKAEDRGQSTEDRKQRTEGQKMSEYKESQMPTTEHKH